MSGLAAFKSAAMATKASSFSGTTIGLTNLSASVTDTSAAMSASFTPSIRLPLSERVPRDTSVS